MPSIFDFKHIAIVQTAFLGDIALALPLAQSIKDINPDVIISFITTPAGASIVALSPAVDNVIAYDKRGLESGWHGIRLMADLIKEKKIDCILALHRSLRTTLLSKLSGVDYTVSYNTSAMSFLYKKNIKYEKDLHEVERCLTM
ncbi:MAG: ADP-heptose--LPS heptosyltransferase, partial [Bacteroidota bacterium]